ncbi:MAG: PaaI family thioesterase [Pyrinomonadaceae bacterium]|nr:PaaI family thioesterase [Pyrinomonadaceae bacterium]
MKFTPKDENFVEKVRTSFSAQSVMKLIGAEITRIEAGAVDIELPYRKDLTQQNGFVHAGIITAIADTACGYAAFSLMPKNAEVLSVEFKVNLLSPAIGEKFLAEGRVLRAGKTLTIVQGNVFAVSENQQKHVATMLATLMCLQK